jgi:hypothetical protein
MKLGNGPTAADRTQRECFDRGRQAAPNAILPCPERQKEAERYEQTMRERPHIGRRLTPEEVAVEQEQGEAVQEGDFGFFPLR